MKKKIIITENDDGSISIGGDLSDTIDIHKFLRKAMIETKRKHMEAKRKKVKKCHQAD